MNRLSLPKEDKDLLQLLLGFARRKKLKLYLVGGYLRDILLKREKKPPDIDFCLRKNAIAFAGRFAREIKAGFVVLDKEHGSCRIVKKTKNRAYTLDFTDFRGKTLEEDLLHRDFTINTLALELKDVFSEANLSFLIDHYSGRSDLEAGIIRVAHKKSFDEDPLRILRAFSFACIFGFKIDKKTLELIRLKKNKIPSVSCERLRDELFKILDSPDAFNYLVKLDSFGILKLVFPEIEIMRGVKQGPYHHLDVFKHSLETVRQFQILNEALKNDRQIQDYLDEVISGARSRRSLIKLGALFHDVGKPKAMRREDGKTKFHGHERIGCDITTAVARRLKLSNDELDSLRKMVFWHLRPGYLADNEDLSPRAIFRYFRDTAQEAVSVLLLSIADQRSTKGRLTSKESRLRHEKVCLGLIKEYFRRKKEKKLKRLLNGNEVMRKFKLEPSILVGMILSELEELQAITKIKTKKEALVAAGEFIRNQKKNRSFIRKKK